MKPMTMFELAPLGIPLAIAGIAYLTIFGPKLIPARSSITGSLEIDSRTSPLYHLLIGENSNLIGKPLSETPLADRALGIHVMEVRRHGARLMLPAVEDRRGEKRPLPRRPPPPPRRCGQAGQPCSNPSARRCFPPWTASSPNSSCATNPRCSDEPSPTSDFRQTYNCVVLAVHRNGVNITSRIAELPLEIGDTLLVITALNNLDALEATRDFVLTDSPEDLPEEAHAKKVTPHVIMSWAVLIGVVLTATLTDVLARRFSPPSRSSRSTTRRWSARWCCCGCTSSRRARPTPASTGRCC